MTPPIALTIAGSDSGGGAGIQADLKTFAASRVHGTTVLTLVTAQNTRGVTDIQMLPAETVVAQFRAVLDDLPPQAAKTGALGSVEMIDLVADLLQERPVPNLVVDPVMISTHGIPLLSSEGGRRIRDRLLPQALIVTPNRFEAAELTGMSNVESVTDMKEAARRLFDCGVANVVVKGGHFENIARDIFFDGSGFVEFGADRVDSDRVHGSGCTYAAALVARLAHGDELLESLVFARDFISAAIAKAPKLGGGISPVHPMHAYWS